MKYLDQYCRDIYALCTNSTLPNKGQLFWIYQYLCVKNVIGKITWINYKSEKLLGITFHFDNFYAFFALFTEIFIYTIYHFPANKPNPLIIDCGWNIGMSVLYFKYLYPQSHIVCYEPDKETFSILEKNVKANNITNVELHNKAVWWENGELEFYSFSDMKGGPGNTLERTQVTFPNITSYKVPVIALSSLQYPEIDFLKIDIEGTEWKLFADFDRTGFLDKVTAISLEYHYDYQSIDNSLSKILASLESNKYNVIVNANTLVGTYISQKKYHRFDKRYVIMLDCFK